MKSIPSKKTIEQLEEEELPKYLEKGELALFLKTAKEHGSKHDYLMFLILSYSSIRAGELIALKWKGIVFLITPLALQKTVTLPAIMQLNTLPKK